MLMEAGKTSVAALHLQQNLYTMFYSEISRQDLFPFLPPSFPSPFAPPRQLWEEAGTKIAIRMILLFLEKKTDICHWALAFK